MSQSNIRSIIAKWKRAETTAAEHEVLDHIELHSRVQTSSGIKISTKTVCRELHGMCFYSREPPAAVKYM